MRIRRAPGRTLFVSRQCRQSVPAVTAGHPANVGQATPQPRPVLLSVTAAGGVSDRRAGSARPAQANRHYGQGNRDHDSGSDAPGGRNGRHCQQQGNGRGGEGGGSHGWAATSTTPFRFRVHPSIFVTGPGQPIQQLTSRARAGHHHHGGPRPGDPLQLLAGAQGRQKILVGFPAVVRELH